MSINFFDTKTALHHSDGVYKCKHEVTEGNGVRGGSTQRSALCEHGSLSLTLLNV